MTEPIMHDGPVDSYLTEVCPRTPTKNRPVRTKFTPTHRPLITADYASSTHSRFQALFSTALSPRLSPRENARFIDRFRYVICTSQLLSENIVSTQHNKLKADVSEQEGWDTRKAAKYWMGSGGCVLLLSVIITWAMKSDRLKERRLSTLVLSLLLALYLYAQSRRAYTRLLHSKAAALIQSAVLHCQNFDSATCKVINLIQEVELISRGYQIGSVLPPIARIEANSRHRRCMRLRTTLVSSLNLVYSAYNRASTHLEQITNTRDFNKLSDVYNIIVNDDDDVSLLCDESDSIAYIKTLFHQVHSRRRKLLCCLLAVQADGRPGNIVVWKAVCEQLQTISDLMANLSSQLEESLVDEHELNPNQIAPDAQRNQQRTINNLSQTLRRTQAKMYILREESSRILQQPDLATGTREELLTNYDSLEADLHALLADWQEGRRMLQTADSEPSSPYESEDFDSKTVVIRDSIGFWGPRIIHDTPPTAPIDTLEEVFEGESLPAASRPSITRAERIAIMRQEREIKQARTMERLQQQKTRESLQGELKDVLGRRPLGLRINSRRSENRKTSTQSVDSGVGSSINST